MGNIKRRTPNTWIHELTPQTLVWRLDYLWVHLARTNPSRTRDLSHKPESQFARRCFARERTTQQSVNILNRDTYIWVGFQSQCLFSLIPFFSLKERQIHFRRIHFRPSENQGGKLPSFGGWSDTAPTRLGPTETWLASNKTSAILDSQSAGMRHLRKQSKIGYNTMGNVVIEGNS